MRFPVRDGSLPHQVILALDSVTKTIKVTCNCLIRRKEYMPGETKNFEDTRNIYNDPKNHNPEAETFRTPLSPAVTER